MDKKSKLEEQVQEEIIRDIVHKVRNEMKPAPKSNKAWKLLNSAFALWFLSSVLIAGVSWGYANWNEKNNNLILKTEKIKKLDDEISYRLDAGNENLPEYPDQSFVNAWCLSPSTFSLKPQLFPTNTISSIANNNEPQQWDNGRYIFPEFKDRSIFSLVWELLRLVPNNEKKPIIKAQKLLQDMKGSVSLTIDKKMTTKVFLSKIIIERWK